MAMKKKTRSRSKTKLKEFAQADPSAIPLSPGDAPKPTDITRYKNFQFAANEEASILTDYIRQYVGTARAIADGSSGVFLQQDKILLTQSYNDIFGYDLYDEIEKDPHIGSILQTRKLAVAGLEWRIDPGTDDERDKKLAAEIQLRMKKMVGLTQDMIELLDAILKGFAVSEIIWMIDPDGFVRPRELMNRPQRRFQFDAVTREPKLRKISNPFYGDPLSAQKFIIHRNSQKYENPFGDALGQKLFWGFLFKRMVTKFWMQHAETGSAPVPLVKHPKNASKEIKDDAMDVARQIRVGSYGIIPEDFELLWAETKNVLNTGESYEKYLRFNNDEMTKAVLGQILTTEASGSSGSGSRALGGVHNMVREDILLYDAKCLAETLTQTLVKFIVDQNYSGIENYPVFTFVLEEGVDLVQITTAIKNLKDAGYRTDPAFIESIGIPLEKDAAGNYVVPAAPQPAAAPFSMPQGGGDPPSEFAEGRQKHEKKLQRTIANAFEKQKMEMRNLFDHRLREIEKKTGEKIDFSSFPRPSITVNVPKQEAPQISFAQPSIKINIPKQSPPVVHVNVAPPKTPKIEVNVAPPNVNVQVDPPDVHIDSPKVEVNLPKDNRVKQVDVIRDAEGRIKKLTSE